MERTGSLPRTLHALQETALRAHAAETGDPCGLLYFHWANGTASANTACLEAARRHSPDGEVLAILATPGKPDASERRLNELISETSRPWVLYCIARHWVTRGEPMRAVRCATRSLQCAGGYSPAIHLVARHAMARGDRLLAAELLGQSLRMSPGQRDLPTWLDPAAARLPAVDSASPPTLDLGFYLPVYNAEATLAPVIDSILGQAQPLSAFIVIDDGCTDRSCEIAEQRGVMLVRHDRNRGLAAARNTALTALATKFAASCDSDAVLEPDYLIYIAIEFELGGSPLAAVGGRMHEFHTDTLADAWRAVHLSQDTGPLRTCSLARLPGHPPQESPTYLPGCNIVLRRDAALDSGGYDQRYRAVGEDGDLSRKLHRSGHALATTPLAHCHHLRRDTPLSVLRTSWNYNAEQFEGQGCFRSVRSIVRHLREHRVWATAKIDHDREIGRSDFLYMEVLYVWVFHLLDLRALARNGQLSAGQCRWMTETVLTQIRRARDAERHRLWLRLDEDLRPLRPLPDSPVEPIPATIEEEHLRALNEVISWSIAALADAPDAVPECPTPSEPFDLGCD
jgi:glycosyltransferase involved in cell wall biosynthesis